MFSFSMVRQCCSSCVSLGGFWDFSQSFFIVVDSDPEVNFLTLGDDFRNCYCTQRCVLVSQWIHVPESVNGVFSTYSVHPAVKS